MSEDDEAGEEEEIGAEIIRIARENGPDSPEMDVFIGSIKDETLRSWANVSRDVLEALNRGDSIEIRYADGSVETFETMDPNMN